MEEVNTVGEIFVGGATKNCAGADRAWGSGVEAAARLALAAVAARGELGIASGSRSMARVAPTRSWRAGLIGWVVRCSLRVTAEHRHHDFFTDSGVTSTASRVRARSWSAWAMRSSATSSAA
jgi:hypothetical protein